MAVNRPETGHTEDKQKGEDTVPGTASSPITMLEIFKEKYRLNIELGVEVYMNGSLKRTDRLQSSSYLYIMSIKVEFICAALEHRKRNRC